MPLLYRVLTLGLLLVFGWSVARAQQKPLKPDLVKKIEEALPAKATVAPAKKRNLLIYTRANGFVHSSIPYGAEAMRQVGEKTGAWSSVVTDDPEAFAPESLKKFDAVCLVNTTGEWLKPKFDNKTITNEERVQLLAREADLKVSLMEFLTGGGGLVGFHAASDSYYGWSEFGTTIGGYFDGHPWHQKIMVKVEEPDHPLLRAFEGKDFEITDEIYQFKNPYDRGALRVLLSMDLGRTQSNAKGKRQDGDYAVAWVRPLGKGRVFYSSLGHREEIYYNPAMLRFYLDGVQFAMGDLEADALPRK